MTITSANLDSALVGTKIMWSRASHGFLTETKMSSIKYESYRVYTPFLSCRQCRDLINFLFSHYYLFCIWFEPEGNYAAHVFPITSLLYQQRIGFNASGLMLPTIHRVLSWNPPNLMPIYHILGRAGKRHRQPQCASYYRKVSVVGLVRCNYQ